VTNQDIYDYYKNIPRGSRGRTITDHFNSLTLEERKSYTDFLKSLSPGDSELDTFTTLLRNQAVKDFWDNERELVKQGKGTRDWTVEQQKTILNIDSNGKESKHAGTPKGADGVAFQGQHMFAVDDYPQFAGDYRNIQALHGSAFVT